MHFMWEKVHEKCLTPAFMHFLQAASEAPLEGDDEATVTQPYERGRYSRKKETNEYAVLIESGSEEKADQLAAKYGYKNIGRVSQFGTLWKKPFYEVFGAGLPDGSHLALSISRD